MKCLKNYRTFFSKPLALNCICRQFYFIKLKAGVFNFFSCKHTIFTLHKYRICYHFEVFLYSLIACKLRLLYRLITFLSSFMNKINRSLTIGTLGIILTSILQIIITLFEAPAVLQIIFYILYTIFIILLIIGYRKIVKEKNRV